MFLLLVALFLCKYGAALAAAAFMLATKVQPLLLLLQLCGVALATAGFIIATRDFGIPYKEVLMHHGTLGVAVLTLVYFQVRSSKYALKIL
jgi:hypothetical protein